MPFPPPIISFNHSTFVRIYHPIHSFPRIEFLSLHAFDGSNGTIGFHYDTAIVACGILAGSRWDGYLTETRGGGLGWGRMTYYKESSIVSMYLWR
jgi:hypothetical protein